MDKLDRRLIQLQIEREAVRREKDEASQKRFGLIEEEIGKLQKEISDLDEIWKAEKAQAQGSKDVMEEIDKHPLPDRGIHPQGRLQQGGRAAIRQAARAGKAPEGGAGDRGEQGRRTAPPTAAAHAGRRRGNRRSGGPRHRHSGSQADAGRARQAAADGRQAARARGGPGRSHRRGGQRDSPLALGPVATRTGRPARSCSSAPRASARPSCARRWPASCSTAKTTWSAST